ncbi:MAG TPA: serine/threonine-protein kinase, partial [Gemmata sp.]|nr:serine/threonine-protein kinase [Gemmata sp.]
DFRIVRELGRGGMGIVFEAVQESLDRPVALKVLPTHVQMNPVRRERFVREAHAAARLHHTNIVPVFGVGEQDGLPYYVMQLIRGEGLHTIAQRWRKEREKQDAPARSTLPDGKTLADRSSPLPDAETVPDSNAPAHGNWAFIAEVGLQTADSLHYAHTLGVLHRDVKPGNLILDPSRRVWITDFGLAKLVEQEGLTATGDILGTLQYLPPECLAGEADLRSDVYGLGATLYELLTLEPPYPLDNPARLIKQVTDADPIPPRERNPAIPRDLETIVLKAMAREPAHRYSSAHEMASDLQAFLEDRPITARRQSAISRGWRWCRRNPAVAALSANMVAALLLAGVVGWIGYVKTKRALDAEARQLTEAQQARTEAVQASEKLEANLRMSLESFEAVFEAAGGNSRFGGPGFHIPRGGPGGGPDGPKGTPGSVFFGGPFMPLPLLPGGPKAGPGGGGLFGPGPEDRAAAMLEEVLKFYDKFAERNETNPRLQLDAARASRRTGELHVMRGNAEKAAASFCRAEHLLENLCRKSPDNADVRAELIETYLHAPPEVFPDHEALLLLAIQSARQLTEPPRPNLPGSLLFKLGYLRERAGNRTEAEQAYREAIADFAAPAGGPDLRPPPAVAEEAFARSALASLLVKSERRQEARELLERSLAELQTTREHPRRPQWELIWWTQQQLADVLDGLGDKIGAEQARAAARGAWGQFQGPGGKGEGGFGRGKKESAPSPRSKH